MDNLGVCNRQPSRAGEFGREEMRWEGLCAGRVIGITELEWTTDDQGSHHKIGYTRPEINVSGKPLSFQAVDEGPPSAEAAVHCRRISVLVRRPTLVGPVW
jgi:hypothetical protein